MRDNLENLATYKVQRDSINADITELYGRTVNVKDYGAIGNGVVDDTAAIQSAIDAIGNGGILFFTSGNYLITSTLDFTDITHSEFIGIGSGLSGGSVRFKWGGNNSTPMLDLSGTQSLTFKNLSFYGNNTGSTNPANFGLIGVYCHTGAGQSTLSNWERCNWYFWKTGMQMGHLTVNEDGNEMHTFNSCEWHYCDIGYRQHWPNSIGNEFRNCGSSNMNVVWMYLGDPTNIGTGDIYINGYVSSLNKCDIFFNCYVYLSVINARTENSDCFIDSNPLLGTAGPGGLVIVNLNESTHSDHNKPSVTYNHGNVIFIGGRSGDETIYAANPWLISSTPYGNAVYQGFSFPSLDKDLLFSTGVGWNVTTTGCSGYDPNDQNYKTMV